VPPPTPQEHLTQASKNEAFYRQNCGGDATARQWAMVALFYCAMHEVQAFIVAHGQRPESHSDRTAVLRANEFQLGKDLRRHYRRLIQYGHDVRYAFLEPTPQDLTDAEDRLTKIRNEISRLTSSSRKLLPR
jgi:uncharacterized protein (UPF0332 family)